jgi:superfamily II DNA/RNA helicase
VLDEADTLFKDDFIDEVKQIIDPIKKKSDTGEYNRQFITVSATLPRDITKSIDKLFPVHFSNFSFIYHFFFFFFLIFFDFVFSF